MEKAPQETQGISLYAFLTQLKQVIMTQPALQSQWIVAEISDLRISRHGYMQLLEKDSAGNTVATARATIWQNSLFHILSKFSTTTGQDLANGMKVMLNASVNMSQQYGLSLNITDIYPEYTLGDMQRIRREILNRLSREGVIDMNKQLPLPLTPQRIAVISANGAAGYGDFCNQLHNNPFGIKFYTCLFAATMQGQNTAPSVINALERINNHLHLFDLVVIIRGGGATTDLNSFDNYDLAMNVANCNLPVITGIGHERDVTVIDYVAAVCVKTPTAAAEWLIDRCHNSLLNINELQTAIATLVNNTLSEEKQHLSFIADNLPILARNIVERSNMQLTHFMQQIPTIISSRIATAHMQLNNFARNLATASAQCIKQENMRLSNLTDKVNLLSPQNILNRGYSITTVNGHAVTNAAQLQPGDQMVTHFKEGKVTSTVNK
ncbi:MAG: exodeoxyribonuclease VII large subunit [Muribaculaceae bacterium]